MSKKLTHEEAVAKANIAHNGKYEYVSLYPGSKGIWKIKCPLHGVFEQRAGLHYSGSECPLCSPQHKWTNEEFIEHARAEHGSQYEYVGEYQGNDIPYEIRCPLHGSFFQRPRCHIGGDGCPACGDIRRADHSRWTYEQFVEESRKVHGDKYAYPGKYVNSRTHTEIECPAHSIFWQMPAAHVAGHGCPKCQHELARKSPEQFWQEIYAIHGDTYAYHSEYTTCHGDLTIECYAHGLFEQRASHHREGHGCPDCSPNANMGKEKFVERANIIHGFKFQYPGGYVNGRTPTEIVCLIHGSFWQKPISHLSEYGCPSCGNNYVSEVETQWLDEIGVPRENRQLVIMIGEKLIKPDGFDPGTNTIYEFYGDYWHGNPAVFEPDGINVLAHKTFGALHQATLTRAALIKEAGYNLVSIWESDWKLLKKETAA